MDWSKLLEIFGVAVGLVYLYLEYKANRWVWLASVIMPCISMWIYFSRGLYADFSINIYYLVIAVYGWIHWSRKERHPQKKATVENTPIIHTPRWLIVPLVAVTAALWWLLWWLLTEFTDSTVAVADAFTTALSITALWMMARKQAEQWLVWMVVDAVCVGLYFYKGIPFYGCLYGLYTVIAIFGYRKWCRMVNG